MIRFNFDISVFGLIMTAASAGLAIYTYCKGKKFEKAAKNLGVTLDDLAKNGLDSKVTQQMLDTAIYDAASKLMETRTIVAQKEAQKDCKEEIVNICEATVNEEYEDIKPLIRAGLKEQVNKIDTNKLRNEVAKEVKSDALKAFDSDREAAAAEYRKRLDGLYTQYETMLKDQAKTFGSLSNFVTNVAKGQA